MKLELQFEIIMRNYCCEKGSEDGTGKAWRCRRLSSFSALRWNNFEFMEQIFLRQLNHPSGVLKYPRLCWNGMFSGELKCPLFGDFCGLLSLSFVQCCSYWIDYSSMSFVSSRLRLVDSRVKNREQLGSK